MTSPSDQEINEKVAMHLGWEHVSIGPETSTGYWIRDALRDEQGRIMRPKEFPFHPDYCTDIWAAWEVVEHIAKKLDPNGDVKETAHPDGRMRFVGHGFKLEHHTENTEEKWVCTLPEIVCAPSYEEMNDDILIENGIDVNK